MARNGRHIGILLTELVNRISHRNGETLRIMAESQVTLQQVLLLTRLRQAEASSASELASNLALSLPAISQAVDRLVRLGLVTRIEDEEDRRKKKIATTAKANALLERIMRARSNEYSAGLSGLSRQTHDRLERLLREALKQLQ